MTNSIVLISVLLSTNWVDTPIKTNNVQIQVGRIQTNYLVKPAMDTTCGPNDWPVFENSRVPEFKSEPFYGPWNLTREVQLMEGVWFATNSAKLFTNIFGGVTWR